MQRTIEYLLAVTLVAIFSFSAFADNVPPTTPELTYATYSETSTEVFWTRSIDDDVFLTYDLTRNGQLVYSGDGLSYFDSSLDLGEQYIYTVTVTDQEGLTSEPVSLTVKNGEIPGFVSVTEPTGLRATVYSASALELFWDRDEMPGTTYFYYQDNALLGLTDGTSAYIDENISAGGVYTFSIEARRETDRDVDVSDRVSIEVVVPGDAEIVDPELTPLRAPSDLSASTYSPTLVELFWNWDSDEGIAYNYYQDGVLLGEVESTTVLIDENVVSAGGIYTFSVQAKRDLPDGNVELSELSSIVVVMPGSPPAPPLPPNNVSLSIYSNTEAELFWDEYPIAGEAITTEVFRNELFIGSVEGNSYYDDTISTDTTDIYTLVAVNADGIRSEPAQYPPIPVPDPEFSVTSENLDDVIFNIARIVRGEVLNDLVVRAIEFTSGSIAGLSADSVVSQDFGSNGTETVTTYTCDVGGSMTLTDIASPEFESQIATIDNCNLGGRTFDGEVRFDYGILYKLSDFTTIFPDNSRAVVTGAYTNLANVRVDGLGERKLIITSYEESNQDGTMRPVSSYITSTEPFFFSSTDQVFNSQWTASGPFSNNVELQAETTQRFLRLDASDKDFETGRLVVSAENGLVIIIDADNGNLDTFSVTVIDGGSEENYTVNWTDSIRFFIAI